MKPNTPKERARIEAQLVALKIALATEIADILDMRELTQTEAAFIMRDAPSQISLVVTAARKKNAAKLRGFSLERLLRMLALLARTIEVVSFAAKGKAGAIVATVGRQAIDAPRTHTLKRA